MRKPSCLILCSQPEPEGGTIVGDGKHGSIIPCRSCRPNAPFTAGAFGFLTFTQCAERPDRYGESSNEHFEGDSADAKSS